MSKLDVYSARGTKKGKTSLPKDWKEGSNIKLLAQAIRVYEDRKHPGLSKTKSRGEVSLSGRKIWAQKGTGRARHGARSAPIFVGGGTTHGPKGVKRRLFLPKKMRKKALAVALTQKSKEGNLVVVEGISSLKKTKEGKNLLEKIKKGLGKKTTPKRTTFVLAEDKKEASLALRNLKDVGVVSYNKLNAHTVFFGGLLVVDKGVFSENKKDKKNKK